MHLMNQAEFTVARFAGWSNDRARHVFRMMHKRASWRRMARASCPAYTNPKR